jgi:hypothetical protein
MNGHAGLLGRLAQPIQKCLMIGIIAHDRLVIVTLCDHMVQLIGDDEAWQASHDASGVRGKEYGSHGAAV